MPASAFMSPSCLAGTNQPPSVRLPKPHWKVNSFGFWFYFLPALFLLTSVLWIPLVFSLLLCCTLTLILQSQIWCLLKDNTFWVWDTLCRMRYMLWKYFTFWHSMWVPDPWDRRASINSSYYMWKYISKSHGSWALNLHILRMNGALNLSQ